MKKSSLLLLGLIILSGVIICGGCGGHSGPTTVFSEDFESFAPQNPWTSANWTDYNTGVETTWEIIDDAGNKVLRHVATNGMRINNKYSGDDYTLSARIKPGNTGTCAAIVARFTDSTHYYWLDIVTPGLLEVRKGGSTGDPPMASYTFNTTTWYTLTLQVNGSLITGTVTDGVTSASVSLNDDGSYDGNPGYGSGRIGVYELNGTGTCYDDIKVTEP